MPVVNDARSREPRRFLDEPARFGRDPSASWKPLVERSERVEVVEAYWQHLAVCSLRESVGAAIEDEIVDRVGGLRPSYLRRQLSGEYRLPLNELVGWVLAFDDITLLPAFDSVSALLPPAT